MSENWSWQEVELPDEWSVDAGAPNFTTVGVGPEDGRPVAILVDLGFHGWGKLSAEGTANLNLIAAAPDLLVALRQLVAASQDYDASSAIREALKPARAVIARVEGGGGQ